MSATTLVLAKVTGPAGETVTARLVRDEDGCRAVRLSGKTGTHVVTCDAPRGGWDRAVGHAAGYLQDYGYDVPSARDAAAALVGKLRAQVDPVTDAPLLSLVVTPSTGYVRVWGKTSTGREVKVGTAGSNRRSGSVWSHVLASPPAYLRAAAEAARDAMEATVLRAVKARKRERRDLAAAARKGW